jgi:cell division protein FtsA
MAKNDDYVVGLDVGTIATRCVVAKPKERGALDILGVGTRPSQGMRKGMIVNLEAAVEVIRGAVEDAELMSGKSVGRAAVSLSGERTRSINYQGVVAVSGKNRAVLREDVNRVIEAARQVQIPPDSEVLHVLPQEYQIDGQDGISDPVGMSGDRLEANVHVVTVLASAAQNLVTCINRAGVEVTDLVLPSLAAAEAVLTADERELGVAMVDVGGGTTHIAIFERGSVWHTAVLPVGGENVTKDIAVGLRTPIPEAERIKRHHASALDRGDGQEETLEVPPVGGRRARVISRAVLSDVVQARTEEMCRLMLQEIERAGLLEAINAGLVVSGGGSALDGFAETAEQVFNLPVRPGTLRRIGGLVDEVNDPTHAVSVGLTAWAAAHRTDSVRAPRGLAAALSAMPQGGLSRAAGRVRQWFAELF